jgi:hypothetical protein
LEQIRSAYIGALMTYIELEYDNIPETVTDEMEGYFEECFGDGEPMCLPNAAGGFWERFLKTPETL